MDRRSLLATLATAAGSAAGGCLEAADRLRVGAVASGADEGPDPAAGYGLVAPEAAVGRVREDGGGK
jgi:hypothetical protein